METYIRPPEPLCGVGNMAENWQRWKKDFHIFLKASNNVKKSKDVKAYLLRSHIGTVGVNAIEKIVLNNSIDRDDINVLLTKLDTYFDAPKSEVVERYNFFTRSWGIHESIEDYIDDLKKKAMTCNFGHIMNSLIRDKVIAEIKDKDLRNKLFEIENLDLFKLTLIYNEHKMIMQEKKLGSRNNTINRNTELIANIDSKNIRNIDSNVNTTKLLEQNPESRNKGNKRQCWRCRQRHAIRSCPAWGSKCEKCGERNHFTWCCQSVDTSNGRREMNKSKTNTNSSSNLHMNLQKKNLQTNSVQNNSMGGYVRPSSSGHPNMCPSAPEFPEDGSVLYPNLNYMKASENNQKPWSWVEQNIKTSESFQKSEASMPTREVKGEHSKTNEQRTSVTNDGAATSTNTSADQAKEAKDTCIIS